jgi:hypothetical protein
VSKLGEFDVKYGVTCSVESVPLDCRLHSQEYRNEQLLPRYDHPFYCNVHPLSNGHLVGRPCPPIPVVILQLCGKRGLSQNRNRQSLVSVF